MRDDVRVDVRDESLETPLNKGFLLKNVRDDRKLYVSYFNNSNIVSGVVCIFVMAHKPIPISFTLAPSR